MLADVHTAKVCLLEDGEVLARAVGDAVGLVEGSMCFCTFWRSFAPHRLPALRLFESGLHYSSYGRVAISCGSQRTLSLPAPLCKRGKSFQPAFKRPFTPNLEVSTTKTAEGKREALEKELTIEVLTGS